MNQPHNEPSDSAEPENRPSRDAAGIPPHIAHPPDARAKQAPELDSQSRYDSDLAAHMEPESLQPPTPSEFQSAADKEGDPRPDAQRDAQPDAQPDTGPEISPARENHQVVGHRDDPYFPGQRSLRMRMWPDFTTPLHGVDLLYLLCFYFVAGAILTVAVAGAAMLGFHLSAATLQKSVADRSAVMIVSQGLLSVATVIFLYALIRWRSAIPFWNALGWRPFRLPSHDAGSQLATILQYVLGGFALAVAVGWLSRFFNQQTELPMEDLFRSRETVLLLMGLGILVAPVVEETVFRGCIFPVLARKMGVPAGVIVTGTLFGIAHAQQLWGGWGEIALLICVGIVLTYVRARAGTVAASYLVHVSYNTILFTGFYFATHGLRYFPPS